MAEITVEEASEAYAGAMSNTLPSGSGVCVACRTFIDPAYERCYSCASQPETLDVIVPITYSVHLGQMHTALRNYKDGYGLAVRRYAQTRVAAILWRFIETHEVCIAQRAGVPRFDTITTVPSSSAQRDDNSTLRIIAGWCRPIKDRLDRVIGPAGDAPSTHQFDNSRFSATRDLTGSNVLLIDDTWTTGAHARSAGHALKRAGANTVACVAIGRHVRPDWEVDGKTSGEIVGKLPPFDYSRCCLDD